MGLRGNQSTARALNRRLVLNELRREGPLGRAAIAAAVGLSPAAVTFVTAELIAEGLLAEREAVAAATGRRPVPLEIDYASRYSIGLKVTVERVIGVVTDLATRVVAKTELPLSGHDPQSVVAVSAEVIEGLLAHTRTRRSKLIGVGLTLAGQVDVEAGICRQMQRFGWRDVPLGAMLAEIVALPVWVDNDANAFAVSQYLFGQARGRQSIAAIAAGRGVGAGFVINGRLYRGGSGAAGEFGHNFEERGRYCECGRDGCVETYCSDVGLLRTWAERDSGARGKSIEQLAAAAESGDLCVRQILRESGQRLGRHVAALVNVFNPEMIVFGGEGVRFGRFLFDPLKEILAEVCYPGPPPVAFDWEQDSWERGAAALAIEHFFNFEATGGYAPKRDKRKIARSSRMNPRPPDARRPEVSHS